MAEQTQQFASASVRDGMLVCEALNCEADAAYRIEEDGGKIWVSFVTPNRWLSESVEADLEHTGDKLGELIEEELVDLGIEDSASFEHYRSDDMLFTFRSAIDLGDRAIDSEAGLNHIIGWLRGYEMCFHELGDVFDDGESE